MNLGEILAEEDHKTPGKILAGDDRNATARPLLVPGKALAEDIRGAIARPVPGKFPLALPCSCQPTS